MAMVYFPCKIPKTGIKELTGVCVIDYDTELVIYDQLVKPLQTICQGHYLLRSLSTFLIISFSWSGITQAIFEPVTTPCQKFNPISCPSYSHCRFSSNLILLGHPLESDLKVLKLCHPRCIDTALIYHHPRGRPLKPDEQMVRKGNPNMRRGLTLNWSVTSLI
jgi:RNA exonuclease 1